MKQVKSALFLTLAALPGLMYAQGAYNLEGKIIHPEEGSKVYLTVYKGNTKSTDSVNVNTDGSFIFKGSIIQPTMSGLRLKHGHTASPVIDEVIFYLEKGQLKLSTPDSMYKAAVTGSKTTAEFMNLGRMVKVVENKYIKWQHDPANSNITNEERTAQYRAFQQERKETFKKFIIANPQSQVSLDAIKDISGPVAKPEIAMPLYQGLSTAVKNTPAGKEFGELLMALGNVQIGETAPLFSQPDTLGKRINLADYKGKYVLVDFWASWCGPCRAENPNVLAQYNKHKDQNFTVLSVSIDEQRDRWMKAIHEDRLPWVQVSDLKGFAGNEPAVKYGIKVIPQNFLIDPQGKIVAKNLRGKQLEDKLNELIK